MEEGLNFSMVVSGTTLLTVAGLAVKVWLNGRAQKIEQPLDVRKAPATTPQAQCDERHETINGQIENLFPRVATLEKKAEAAEAKQAALDRQLTSIDNKLDILLRRK